MMSEKIWIPWTFQGVTSHLKTSILDEFDTVGMVPIKNEYGVLLGA